MIEGIILAGGLSARMGKDKAMLPYGEHPLIEHMKNILTHAGLTDIRVSGDREGGVADKTPRAGPVGGICTMILTATAAMEGWLFIPVDMPLLRAGLLQRLIGDRSARDGAGFEKTPLPVLVRRTERVLEHVAHIVEELRDGGDYSVRGFLQGLQMAQLPIPPDAGEQLTNINTPEEWQRLVEQGHVPAH